MSPLSNAIASVPNSRRLTLRFANSIPRRRRPNLTFAPRRPRCSRAGSTNAWESPSLAIRGRQAASPRAKVSRRTGHRRAAAPDRAGVFRAATASGSQNRSNSAPRSPMQSVTVRSGPAIANLRVER